MLLTLVYENASWAKELKDAERLTIYATSARYPTNDEHVTEDEALTAFKIALKVKDVVKNSLIEKGFEFYQ